jgi:hypothetical protein
MFHTASETRLVNVENNITFAAAGQQVGLQRGLAKEVDPAR